MCGEKARQCNPPGPSRAISSLQLWYLHNTQARLNADPQTLQHCNSCTLWCLQSSAQTPLGRCKWRVQQMVNSQRWWPNVQITLWLMSSAAGWRKFRAPPCGGELIRTQKEHLSLFFGRERFRFSETRKIRWRGSYVWSLYTVQVVCVGFFLIWCIVFHF